MRATGWLWGLGFCLACNGPAISTSEGSRADGGGNVVNGDGADGGAPGVDAKPPAMLPPASDALLPEVGASCQRTVSLNAVTIAKPVPFDVVMIVDNSDSLSWSRDSLGRGLQTLLSRVQGHEARFFVLTSTQYGASSQAAISPFDGDSIVTWQDSVSRLPYVNPVTEYRQSCVDERGATITCPTTAGDRPFKLEGTWHFQLPPPVAAITPALTAPELAAQQKRIADAILALGGGGAQQEQPICTLARYLSQRPEALPKNVVFVILSDEDDTSPPKDCLASYRASQVFTPGALELCEGNACSEYTYGVNRPNVQEHLTLTCIPVDDTGMQYPDRALDKTVILDHAASCFPSYSNECGAPQLTRANAACGPGHVVRNCKHVCGPVQGYVYCQLNRPTNAVDLCTQPFDEGGVRHANLVEYCTRKLGGTGWAQCSVQGFRPSNRMLLQKSEYAMPLLPAQTTGDMITQVKSDATRLFGANNHSIEAIILDPSFNCVVHPGQSHGTNLRRLATSQQDVFPLCQDYAPALQRIERFAEYLIQTAFPLTLDVYEDIDSVVVTNRAGQQRTLRKTDYVFDRAARRLTINPGVLGAQDTGLAVNVARHCEPVVK